MSEKLALKNKLYEELHETTKKIEELSKEKFSGNVFDERESLINVVKIEYLSQHRDFILKLISICVDRNKF